MKKNNPNIILINIDDMGYGDLGCYGSLLNDTPNIDKLASEGLRFTDFYAAAPLCTPSRAGMLTGCYPKRVDCSKFNLYDYRSKGEPLCSIGVLLPGQPEGLNPKEETLASILKKSGYSTKIVGKWHVGDQKDFNPTNYGFDSFLGLPYSNDMGKMPLFEIYKEYNLEQPPLPLLSNNEVIEEQPDIAYITELYVNTCCEFIRENKENPFFLYFAHMHVHYPIHCRERFMKQSRNGRMGAALAEVDWSVASIVYQLEELGLTDNTLILLVSDNGGGKASVNTPLRGGKCTPWEGGNRVNCIAKWPNKIKPNTVTNELTSMFDFFPTFIDIANVAFEDDVKRDGYSLVPIFENPDTAKSKYDIFCYYSMNDLVAIRKGKYKYFIHTDELYDLDQDIAELKNIGKEFPDIVKSFETYITSVQFDLGDEGAGYAGHGCRKKGYVEAYQPLTYYDKNKPYIIAEYDLY